MTHRGIGVSLSREPTRLAQHCDEPPAGEPRPPMRVFNEYQRWRRLAKTGSGRRGRDVACRAMPRVIRALAQSLTEHRVTTGSHPSYRHEEPTSPTTCIYAAHQMVACRFSRNLPQWGDDTEQSNGNVAPRAIEVGAPQQHRVEHARPSRPRLCTSRFARADRPSDRRP